MTPQEYEAMYRAQTSLWWYRGMEKITRTVLDGYYRRGGGLKILDAGCGTGASLGLLAAYGEVVALDYSPVALNFSRQQGGARFVLGTVNELPFGRGVFDLVTSFDVICCLGVDDGSALAEYARVLKPGGRVFLRLPAYDWLRGAHDCAVDIRERYTARLAKRRLQQAGFAVERTGYVNTLLFPLAAAKRLSEPVFRPQQASDLTLNYGRLQRLFETVLSSESLLTKLVRLPFGLTVLAVARTKEATRDG